MNLLLFAYFRVSARSRNQCVRFSSGYQALRDEICYLGQRTVALRRPKLTISNTQDSDDVDTYDCSISVPLSKTIIINCCSMEGATVVPNCCLRGKHWPTMSV